jgi:hypothetical protein
MPKIDYKSAAIGAAVLYAVLYFRAKKVQVASH